MYMHVCLCFCSLLPSVCILSFPTPLPILIAGDVLHASLSLSLCQWRQSFLKLWSVTLAFCVLRMLYWIIFKNWLFCSLIVCNVQNECKVPNVQPSETRRPLYRSSSRTHICTEIHIYKCVVCVCLCASMNYSAILL